MSTDNITSNTTPSSTNPNLDTTANDLERLTIQPTDESANNTPASNGQSDTDYDTLMDDILSTPPGPTVPTHKVVPTLPRIPKITSGVSTSASNNTSSAATTSSTSEHVVHNSEPSEVTLATLNTDEDSIMNVGAQPVFPFNEESLPIITHPPTNSSTRTRRHINTQFIASSDMNPSNIQPTYEASGIRSFFDYTRDDIWFIRDINGQSLSIDPYTVIIYLRFDSMVRRGNIGPVPIGYYNFAYIFNGHTEFTQFKFVQFDHDNDGWILKQPAASGPHGLRIRDAYTRTNPAIYQALVQYRLIRDDGTLNHDRLQILDNSVYSAADHSSRASNSSRPFKRPRTEMSNNSRRHSSTPRPHLRSNRPRAMVL